MRKSKPVRRPVDPDPKYQDVVVTKFINKLMLSGGKLTAQKLLYAALDIIREKTNNDELEVFKKALSNVSPAVEVRARRVGGATYQVPSEVPERRKIALAIRWLKDAAFSRRDKSMALKLANEFIAASNGEGASVKKRDDVHRMAEANKAFAHFRW